MGATSVSIDPPTPTIGGASAAALPKGGRIALVTLCMAQFINAYDTTAMNVAVSSVVKSLDTTVTGVQAALTLYSLVMAACMIIGGKLGDIWGRKRVFTLGIIVYGCGAAITALSPTLGVMMAGWSLLEGIGSALMIPAIYALIAVIFPAGKPRISAYAVLAATAAAGAAMGPLLCGFLATYLTWRVSFAMEVCTVIVVVILQFRMPKPPDVQPKPRLDIIGAVLSALGLAVFVLGILQASAFGWVRAREPLEIGGTTVFREGGISPTIVFILVGLAILIVFGFWQRYKAKHGAPLIRLAMFRDRAVSGGLIAILAQMFMQAGILFVTPVFLQLALGYSAMETGLTMLPLTVALILTARKAPIWAQRHSARSLIQIGLITMSVGVLIEALAMHSGSHYYHFIPGGLIIGIGTGLSMAPLLNLVQSAVPEDQESEISGVSRAASNLGGSLGVAVAGAVLMASLITGLSDRIEASPFIPKSHKPAAIAAVHKDAQTLSDAQVRQFARKRGDKPAEVAAIVVINRQARDEALQHAMIAIGVFGLLGFFTSFFLPAEKKVAPGAERTRRLADPTADGDSGGGDGPDRRERDDAPVTPAGSPAGDDAGPAAAPA